MLKAGMELEQMASLHALTAAAVTSCLHSPRPPQFVKFPNPFFSRFQNSSYREPLSFHKKPASVVGVVRTET